MSPPPYRTHNISGFRRFVLVVAITLLAASPAMSAKYAGESFSLGVGGRALALGGAVIAGPFDATAPYWNPAGMNRLDSRYLVAMHAETFGSLLNHDYLSYVDARPREGSLVQAFGFYVYYLGGGGIKITQLNQYQRPVIVREESHGDYLFSGSISGKIKKKIDFGLTAKIIYRDIGTESGVGLTLDAGILTPIASFAEFGLMVTDVTTGFIRYSGKTFSTGANSESIYPTVKPGFALTRGYRDFTGRFLVSGDMKFEHLQSVAQYWSGSLSLDTHYGFELGYRNMLFGRAGFDIGRFTAGGGFDFRRLTVDFAYLHQGDFDATYRVSGSYRF